MGRIVLCNETGTMGLGAALFPLFPWALDVLGLDPSVLRIGVGADAGTHGSGEVLRGLVAGHLLEGES